MSNDTTIIEERYRMMAGPTIVSLIILTISVLLFGYCRFKLDRNEKIVPEDTWRSLFFSDKLLLASRLISFVFIASVQLHQWSTRSGSWMYDTFTLWSFYLLIIFFGFAAFMSITRPGSPGNPIPPNAYRHKVFAAMFSMIMSVSFFLDIVFWVVLYPGCKSDLCRRNMTQFSSVVTHGINFILLLIEFSLNALFIKKMHIFWQVCWMAAYLIFHVIYTGATGTDAIYFFLRSDTYAAPIWILLLVIMAMIFYGLIYGLSMLKARFCLKPKRLTSNTSYIRPATDV